MVVVVFSSCFHWAHEYCIMGPMRKLLERLEETRGDGPRRKVKYYHASPRRFRNGDILTGGHDGGFGYAHDNVCITTSPAPHVTVYEKAFMEDWHVYEVEPLGEVW